MFGDRSTATTCTGSPACSTTSAITSTTPRRKVVGYGVARFESRRVSRPRCINRAATKLAEAIDRLEVQGLEAAAIELASWRTEGTAWRVTAIFELLRGGVDAITLIRGKASMSSSRKRSTPARTPPTSSKRFRQEPLNNLLLVVVVAVGLGFDFTNGSTTTANYVATWVGTRRSRRAWRSRVGSRRTSPVRS